MLVSKHELDELRKIRLEYSKCQCQKSSAPKSEADEKFGGDISASSDSNELVTQTQSLPGFNELHTSDPKEVDIDNQPEIPQQVIKDPVLESASEKKTPNINPSIIVRHLWTRDRNRGLIFLEALKKNHRFSFDEEGSLYLDSRLLPNGLDIFTFVKLVVSQNNDKPLKKIDHQKLKDYAVLLKDLQLTSYLKNKALKAVLHKMSSKTSSNQKWYYLGTTS